MKTVFDIKIDFDKSRGSYLHDKNTGKDFLDFYNLYSSLPLGYNHDIFDASFDSVIRRVSRLRMANNVLQTDELQEFIAAFRKHVFSDFIHFTCTGALAIESAIKCAMEYKKISTPMVFGIRNSFHGINSWGFVTDRCPPTGERVRHFPTNNWKNLTIPEIRAEIEKGRSDVVAVVVEPIQCTGGDVYLDPAELRSLQITCNNNDVCFIVDEIQTGFGTTGKMWYCDRIGLTPDILVFGKKSQICGLVARSKYSECLTSPYQKLEVTFDGDLIDAVRATYILKAYERDGLLAKAEKNSAAFAALLKGRVQNFRSAGHLLAFDLDDRGCRDEFLQACRRNSFLCNSAGERSVRMRPNLALTPTEFERFAEIMQQVLPGRAAVQ